MGHLYPRQNQKTIVVDELIQMGHPGVQGPANEGIPGLLVPACGTEGDSTEIAVDLTGDPVA